MPVATTQQRHRVNLHPQSDPEICLIEFWEDGSDYIVRAAVNSEDYVWQGETYTRSQIDVLLPNSGDKSSTASLEASNVNRAPGQLVLTAERRVNVRMIAVNTYLEQALIDTKTNFYARSKTVEAQTVTMDLASKLDLQEPVNQRSVNRSEFPGAYL